MPESADCANEEHVHVSTVDRKLAEQQTYHFYAGLVIGLVIGLMAGLCW